MPLRDHFHPPVSKRSSWEGFHGLWPGVMVQQLAPRLPEGFVAEPRVHLGYYYEIDVCAFEQEENAAVVRHAARESNGGLASAAQASPAPTLTVDAEFPEQYAYEVLFFDLERERRLGAAIELVNPANKVRPASRRLFAAKCFQLLSQDVCVSIIDIVSIRHFNLYTELLELMGRSDPKFSPPPPTYAITCRKRQFDRQTKLDAWSCPLAIGQPLPSLPIWLSEAQMLSLDLEASYEHTCRVLKIT